MFYYPATDKMFCVVLILLFNYVDVKHDFTYIDGIVEGIVSAIQRALEKMDCLLQRMLFTILVGTPEKILGFKTDL